MFALSGCGSMSHSTRLGSAASLSILGTPIRAPLARLTTRDVGSSCVVVRYVAYLARLVRMPALKAGPAGVLPVARLRHSGSGVHVYNLAGIAPPARSCAPLLYVRQHMVARDRPRISPFQRWSRACTHSVIGSVLSGTPGAWPAGKVWFMRHGAIAPGRFRMDDVYAFSCSDPLAESSD